MRIVRIVLAISLLSFRPTAGLADSGEGAETYIGSMKLKLVGIWRPPQHRMLSVTKLKVTLDSTGAIAKREIVTAGWSANEGLSIDECLKSVYFGKLPSQLNSLELYVSFISDRAIKVVEISEVANSSPKVVTPNIPNSNVGPYIEDLQRRIKRTYHPPKESQFAAGAIVQFTILKSGAITNLKVYKTSGKEDSDRAALKAVEEAAPFAPLASADPLNIQFTFGNWLLAKGET